jgi:hypothetical protein
MSYVDQMKPLFIELDEERLELFDDFIIGDETLAYWPDTDKAYRSFYWWAYGRWSNNGRCFTCMPGTMMVML